MFLQDIIDKLEEEKNRLGNIDLSVETGDGHSTWFSNNLSVEIRHGVIWEGHSQPARYYLKISGGY